MGDRERKLLLSLLKDQRVASLAVLVQEAPYASLVPFAMTGDLSAALIHTSRLARHSEGLATGASFCLLVHEPDTSHETNPAQLARVSLEGRVRSFGRDEEAYGPARDLYLAKFPKSQITFDLADFTLHALQIERCRFVAGFAQTYNLMTQELTALVRTD